MIEAAVIAVVVIMLLVIAAMGLLAWAVIQVEEREAKRDRNGIH